MFHEANKDVAHGTIISTSKPVSYNDHLELFKSGRIVFRFVTSAFELSPDARSKNEAVGLYLISYSPHPSVDEMKQLLTAIKPKRVYPIVYDAYVDKSVARSLRFPKSVADLCQDMSAFEKCGDLDDVAIDLTVSDDEDDDTAGHVSMRMDADDDGMFGMIAKPWIAAPDVLSHANDDP